MIRYYLKRGASGFSFQKWVKEDMPPRAGYEIVDKLPQEVLDEIAAIRNSPVEDKLAPVLARLEAAEAKIAELEKAKDLESRG